MNTTSPSLLERLQCADPKSPDWLRLHELYAPLIRNWITQAIGSSVEVDDLAQEVLLIMMAEVTTFRRQRLGSFRKWMRWIVVNRVRSWRRTKLKFPTNGLDLNDDFLTQLEDPTSDKKQSHSSPRRRIS